MKRLCLDSPSHFSVQRPRYKIAKKEKEKSKKEALRFDPRASFRATHDPVSRVPQDGKVPWEGSPGVQTPRPQENPLTSFALYLLLMGTFAVS